MNIILLSRFLSTALFSQVEIQVKLLGGHLLYRCKNYWRVEM